MKAVLANRDKINALVIVADGGVELSPGAMWEDAKLGMTHLRSWNRAALVAPPAWWDKLVPVLSALMPGEFRSFPPEELAEAKAWLTAAA